MDALQIISRLPWRRARPFARGKLQVPHEYTVRSASPETETAYVALFEAIQSDGVFEYFGSRRNRKRKRYLYPGDGRKYWAMTTKIAECTVLNRMRIEDDLERLRQEGQLDAVEFGLAELAKLQI
jgi:hypothetical protein